VEDRAAKILFDRALRCCDDNITRAADLLGVSRRLLTYRLKELGLRGASEGDEE
jgi:DNA-binding NtrC family response regulator